MIYTANAFARAGLVGNPSDGYFGKTLSFVIRNFKATVRLWESPHFEVVPDRGDLTRFETVDAFSARYPAAWILRGDAADQGGGEAVP